MRLKELLVASALAVSLAAGTHASDEKGDEDADLRTHGEFFDCLKTEAVHFPGTIVDAALATPELSTLVFAVQAAGLVDVLNGEGPFTVFAPLDDAFAAIPAPILDAVIADLDALTAVLTYHVIDGAGRRLDPRRTFFRPKERLTVQGQTVFFNRSSDGPQVNQSNVDCQAVRTDNGTVWLIDSVLMPQF